MEVGTLMYELKLIPNDTILRGVATEGVPGGHAPLSPPPPSPPPALFNFPTKKVHQFQFQTSGKLLFTRVQKLYGP